MSTLSYLQISLLLWGFIFATAVGVLIHAAGERRRRRSFTRHTRDALDVVRGGRS